MTYSVTIGAPSSVVTMDFLNDTIDNLTLSATNTLNIIAGNILTLVSGASSNSGAIFSYGTLNKSSGAYLANFGALRATTAQ